MDDEPVLTAAGGFVIAPPTVTDMQLNMMIWGNSGSGKTTLAATAPGKKLFIMLDPGGELSLTDRDDIAVLNISGANSAIIMAQMHASDPFGIGKILAARPDIETLVIDSMTTLAYVALQYAVVKAGSQGAGAATMDQPGRNGWGIRNQALLRATVGIMRMCAAHKRHLILITHEGAADRDKDGTVTSITMSLSDGVANQTALRFNEIWHVSDTGTQRRISIRSSGVHKPMKTRLFKSETASFIWRYDADTQTGEGIADWYRAWQAGKGKKLPLPVLVPATPTIGGTKK